jgi:hypothetical protein
MIGISCQINGMQKSSYAIHLEYRECRFPRTSLHHAAILDFSINHQIECSWRDEIKAQKAAQLILENKAQVDDEDNYGISAYEYAKVNKWRLPKLWEVMKAGKFVQDVKRVEDLNQSEMIEWYIAQATLEKYANMKSH